MCLLLKSLVLPGWKVNHIITCFLFVELKHVGSGVFVCLKYEPFLLEGRVFKVNHYFYMHVGFYCSLYITDY